MSNKLDWCSDRRGRVGRLWSKVSRVPFPSCARRPEIAESGMSYHTTLYKTFKTFKVFNVFIFRAKNLYYFEHLPCLFDDLANSSSNFPRIIMSWWTLKSFHFTLPISSLYDSPTSITSAFFTFFDPSFVVRPPLLSNQYLFSYFFLAFKNSNFNSGNRRMN